MKAILLLMLLAASVNPFCAGQVKTGQDSDSSGMDVIFLQEIGMWRALQSRDLMAFQSLLCRTISKWKDDSDA
jgi:hypothetical protein